MICDQCETVVYCTKNGCIPKQPLQGKSVIEMSRETMKLALEALVSTYQGKDKTGQVTEAITALRKALAEQALDMMAENARELGLDYEPAQQEPEWYHFVRRGDDCFVPYKGQAPANATALYTSPQPAQRTWVGLEKSDMPTDPDPMYDHKYFTAGMVYAANKLMEKNT